MNHHVRDSAASPFLMRMARAHIFFFRFIFSTVVLVGLANAAEVIPDSDPVVGPVVEAMRAAQRRHDDAAVAASVSKLEELAKAGNAQALFRLGRYHHMESAQPDPMKAMTNYRAAANKKHAWATNNIGLLYEDLGNLKEAAAWYDRAMTLKEPHSFGNLALFHLRTGKPEGVAKGLEILEKGMKADSTYSFNTAAEIYYKGLYGIKADRIKAVRFYEKSAELGDKWAALFVARAYIEGRGVPMDAAKGWQVLNGLSELNYAPALERMGRYYNEGKGGRSIDQSKALAYWEKAADLGSCSALADLGDAYSQGWGTTVDDVKATAYYDKSVHCGVVLGGWNLWKLGTRYQNASGAAQSCEKAMQLYDAAMRAGYSAAGVDIGRIYERGCGKDIAVDIAKAFQTYLYTAKLGNALAQNNVGAMLIHGIGTGKPDRAKAYAWFLLARANGSALAAKNLVNDDPLLSDADRAAGVEHLQAIRQLLVPPHGPADSIDGRY